MCSILEVKKGEHVKERGGVMMPSGVMKRLIFLAKEGHC